MGNDSNTITITRTKDVPTGNAEIELYLDTNALVRIINQYTRLKVRLGQWATKLGLVIANIQENTSGETTKAFNKLHGDFDTAHYQKLVDDTNKAIEIMRDDAKETANKLRVHCENFYEIVVGNGIMATDSTLATLTPILFLDTTYYDAGVMDDNTVDAATKLKKLDEDANDLYGILLSCHYREHLEDCSADIENIRSDCKNRTRLQILERAFDNYVRDVKKFNEDISEKFGSIIDPDTKLNHTRSYDYSYVKDDNKIALLTRVVRNELHEMGYTDWEIDRAKKISNLSEVDLACLSEAMIAEGYENWSLKRLLNQGLQRVLIAEGYDRDPVNEITVYRAFLSGNYAKITETLDLYGAPPKGGVLSLALAKHISDCMVVTLSDDQKSIEVINDGVLRDPMNGILNSEYAEDVLDAIKPGLVKYSNTYAEASSFYEEGSKEYALFYSNYVKNRVLADKFENLSALLKDNNHKRYAIQSVDYDVKGVLTFEMVERKKGEYFGLFVQNNDEDSMKYGWLEPAEHVDGDTHVHMETKYVVGLSKVGEKDLDDQYKKAIQKAIKEREEAEKNMVRDGMGAVGAGAAMYYHLNPEVGRTLGVVTFDLADVVVTSVENGELCYDIIVDHKDDYIDIVKKVIPEDTVGGKAIKLYDDKVKDNFTPAASGMYAYFSENGVNDAIEARDNSIRSRYVGSYGCSTITKDFSDQKIVYGVAHSEIIAPEYYHSFESHGAGENHDLQYTGLAKEGKWNPEFADKVDAEIDKLGISEDEKTRCKQLVDGGYSVENILREKEDTKGDVIDTFDHVQTAFDNAYKYADEEIRPELGDDSASDNTVRSIWDKQAAEGARIEIESEAQAEDGENIDEEQN